MTTYPALMHTFGRVRGTLAVVSATRSGTGRVKLAGGPAGSAEKGLRIIEVIGQNITASHAQKKKIRGHEIVDTPGAWCYNYHYRQTTSVEFTGGSKLQVLRLAAWPIQARLVPEFYGVLFGETFSRSALAAICSRRFHVFFGPDGRAVP